MTYFEIMKSLPESGGVRYILTFSSAPTRKDINLAVQRIGNSYGYRILGFYKNEVTLKIFDEGREHERVAA